MYGAKMEQTWGSVPTDELVGAWAAALADLEPDELAAGLSALLRRGSPFPPTLPEFYALCVPPIDVPPVNDHYGLDRLAAEHGVSTGGCSSYYALRSRIIERLNVDRRALPEPLAERAAIVAEGA